MATFSKRLFESLDKLNEMGQLLLVTNNIQGVTEPERNAFKELAIQKHPGMLAGLQVFKLDRNPELLVDTWRRFIGEVPQQLSEESKSQLNKSDVAQLLSKLTKNKVSNPEKAAEAAIKSIGSNGQVGIGDLKNWLKTGGLNKLTDKKKEAGAKSNFLKGLVPKVNNIIKPQIGESELVKLRDILGLGGKKPKVLVSAIKSKMGSKTSLTLDEFSEIILSLEPTNEVSEITRKRNAINIVFGILDENKNGQLDNDEILNSVVVLCGGSPEDKIEAVFSLYDINGDGLISFDELLAHHTSAFKIMFATRPELSQRCGETPEAMAQITVESIFREIDVNNDRVITLPEFKAWYNKQDISAELKNDRDAKIEAFNTKKEQLIHRLKETKRQLTSQERIDRVMAQKQTTGLGEVNVYDALRMFKERNSTGFFTRQQFSEIITDLVKKYSGIQVDEEAFHSLASQLFLKFDNDGNGVVSMRELFCGLSVLCAGSLGSKLKAAVECFDQSGDGELQFNEIVKYFKSIFNMLIPDDITDIKPSSIAQATAKNLFNKLGVDIETGGVSYENLKGWIDIFSRTQ